MKGERKEGAFMGGAYRLSIDMSVRMHVWDACSMKGIKGEMHSSLTGGY